MAEVAIASVEAVFDWKAYLKEEFGYEFEEDEERDALAEEENPTGADAPAKPAAGQEASPEGTAV